MLWDGIARRAFGLGDGGGGEGVTQIAAEREPRSRLKIGLALGGGAARGWSHIGVMRVLQREGIVPDVIAGSSIGAVVGGCYAAGKLDAARGIRASRSPSAASWACSISTSAGSGLIAGDRLRRLLEHDLADMRIENLPLRFATIATELGTGHEIWITRGPLVEALRASYALPGVFDPVRLGGRWLMDGALVNPIPVTTARALGADLVDLRQPQRRHPRPRHGHPVALGRRSRRATRSSRRRPRSAGAGASSHRDARQPQPPQHGRARHRERHGRRLQHHPGPHRPLAPRRRSAGHHDRAEAVGRIGLFEFHRAEECIELGRQATERVLPDLFELMRGPRRASARGSGGRDILAHGLRLGLDLGERDA